MPEVPECTYLTNNLSKNLKGKKLNNIKFISGRYVHHSYPDNYNKFKKSLPLKCTDITNKGKVIFFHFENGWYMISKLGMTGWWYLDSFTPKEDIVFNFSKNTKLSYLDYRNFGTITFTNKKELIDKELNQLAPDILSKTTTFSIIKNRINYLSPTTKNKNIEDIITNQRLIMSGIGNYLKAEVLYDAKISPLRTIKSLSIDDWKQIFTSSKKIVKYMYNALEKDNLEYYTNSMKIYGRKIDPLGNPIIRHKTKTNRSTYWVPAIQK